MKFYELLAMLRNSTTETQVEEFETSLGKCIEKNLNGVLSKTDRWGKLKLAFPIEHKDYANFVLCRFKVPLGRASFVSSEIRKLLRIKLNSTVIRYVLLNLTEKKFLASYKKPEAFVPSSPTSSGGRSVDRSVFGRKNELGVDFESLSNPVEE